MKNNPEIKILFEPVSPELAEKQLQSLTDFFKDILYRQKDSGSDVAKYNS